MTSASPLRPAVFAALATLLLSAGLRAENAIDGGVSMIPKDAAFVTATLRLEEQVRLVLGSNAFASIRNLPPVSQALSQFEEQKSQPGSPLAMIDTYMQLPENQEAVELLRDMVSTDTFLYGEPSCITFLQLIQKVQQAQNIANILTMARGGGTIDIDIDIDAEMGEPDGAALPPGAAIVPVRRQVAQFDDLGVGPSVSNELTTRLVMQALADNADMIVMPDIVWGFKTTKADAATSQVKRLEVLLKLVTQTQPMLVDAVTRRKVPGGEVVTLTIDGAMIPWGGILGSQEGVAEEDLEKVRRALGNLDFAISFGLVGDRVILSIGDSSEHLDKLATPAGGAGLSSTKPFEPLREHNGERITAISYMSEALARAVAPSTDDIDQLAKLADTLADSADLPEGAAREARAMLERISAGYKRRLPEPGPALGYSFLTDKGYEGFTWDWSKNGVLDGSKRLDLLEHTGGAPLASLVMRTTPHPDQFDDFVSWGKMGWDFALKYLLPKADEDARERFEETQRQFAPLAERLVTVLREKFIPSLADGQVAFVIDGKSTVARLHRDVPAAAEPLPLVEPAVALRLSDAKLFRAGLSDLFEIADDFVDLTRSLNPGSVPEGYRIPDPEKSDIEGGALWVFSLERTGIDGQVSPSIAISDSTAVFSLVPKQAGRMLAATQQRTGAPLATFGEPLAGAAALDVAGLVDVVEPWLLYFFRVGMLQQRNGFVDGSSVAGPDLDEGQFKDGITAMGVIFDALRCIRLAVAETSTRSDATVVHWRNLIQDLPAESR